EALEALASFGEEILLLEKEKKSSVKPLVLIPYIGGLITLFTAAVFLSFVQNLAALAKFAFSFTNFATLFLPPIVLNAVLSGLVAGKTSSERVSAGFLHSTILSILTIIVILLLPYFAGLLSIGV
ncbi:secretion system protein, partial [Candidatus Geothermarchaeota archaeon]